jgi:hypothetical protein
MRVTTDTHTGKPFRWNDTCVVVTDDGRKVVVPARYTSREARHLHPSRVPTSLLAKLNPQACPHGAVDRLDGEMAKDDA